MRLKLKLPRVTFEGRTKEEALLNMQNALRLDRDTDGLGYGYSCVSQLSGDLVVYNLHKLNRKVIQEKEPTGVKVYNGVERKFKRTIGVTQEAKWVVQAYIVPKEITHYFGVIFIQQPNHFDIVTVKD